MSQNAATIWTAAAGGIAAIIAGAIAYIAGRRTVHDQEIAQRRQWILDQRQDAYAKFLVAASDVREGAKALRHADRNDVQRMYLESVKPQVMEFNYALIRIQMLGPAPLAEIANSLDGFVDVVLNSAMGDGGPSSVNTFDQAMQSYRTKFADFTSKASEIFRL